MLGLSREESGVLGDGVPGTGNADDEDDDNEGIKTNLFYNLQVVVLCWNKIKHLCHVFKSHLSLKYYLLLLHLCTFFI